MSNGRQEGATSRNLLGVVLMVAGLVMLFTLTEYSCPNSEPTWAAIMPCAPDLLSMLPAMATAGLGALLVENYRD